MKLKEGERKSNIRTFWIWNVRRQKEMVAMLFRVSSRIFGHYYYSTLSISVFGIMCSAHVHIHIVTHIISGESTTPGKKRTQKIHVKHTMYEVWITLNVGYSCCDIVIYTMCYRHSEHSEHLPICFQFAWNRFETENRVI